MVHATAEKKILTTRFANKGVEAEAGGKGKQIFFLLTESKCKC